MDARQGIGVLRIVAPREAIPIHTDDYTLFKFPLSDFRREAKRAGLPTSIRYLERGEAYRLAPGAAGRV
jgi:L-ascorbate metabolism protein UlaG (beta-lactamase superfamily)